MTQSTELVLVVDSTDNFVIWKDADGDPFTRVSAQAFVDNRNASQKAATWKVMVATDAPVMDEVS